MAQMSKLAEEATKAYDADEAYHSNNADTATYAANAGSASSATYASNATSAERTLHAINSDTSIYAKTSGSANSATKATNAGTADYSLKTKSIDNAEGGYIKSSLYIMGDGVSGSADRIEFVGPNYLLDFIWNNKGNNFSIMATSDSGSDVNILNITKSDATLNGTATYSTSAGSASKASSATSATYATTATNADTATYAHNVYAKSTTYANTTVANFNGTNSCTFSSIEYYRLNNGLGIFKFRFKTSTKLSSKGAQSTFTFPKAIISTPLMATEGIVVPNFTSNTDNSNAMRFRLNSDGGMILYSNASSYASTQEHYVIFIYRS